MTQQITTYKNVEFPISHMFNNVRCSKRGYLMNISRPTQIIAHLADSFYVPELDVFVFLDKTHMVCNEWKYQSKDNQTTITFSGFELHMNYATFSDTYREQCIQQYIENGELDVRRNKLNVEINKVTQLIAKILTECVNNMNLTKQRRCSHHQNAENKLIGENSYTKPLFIYDACGEFGDKLINTINKLLIPTDTLLATDSDEKIYVYFSLCLLLKTLSQYITYLYASIDTINHDTFNLNPQCMFNDILTDKLRSNIYNTNYTNPDLDNMFSEYYVIIDNNVLAMDNKSKCWSNGYVLGLSISAKKWNIFPLNTDNGCKFTTDNINMLLKIINAYKVNGINLCDQYL